VTALRTALAWLRTAAAAATIRRRLAAWYTLWLAGGALLCTATALVLWQAEWPAPRELAHALLLALPFALLIGAVGGYAIAGRALAPVRHIIQRTRALRPDAWSDRLPATGPDDELRDLGRVVNELLDRVQASLERERHFADEVAHELRTPLTAQITRAEMTASLLHQGDADPHEAMHCMLEEARHMQRLVTGLLTLSRVATQREAVALRPVDVVAVAEDCVELLRVLAEEKEQSLQVEHDERPRAQAEPTMLRQALLNIVHNAIDHCGTGARIRVRVSSAPAPADDPHAAQRVSITIEDNGPGIATDQLGQVFQRFFRGRGPAGQRRERRSGLGLGLAIAKALTEAQGGRIGVDSVVRRGTRFVITLDAPARAPAPPPHTPRKMRGLLRYTMAVASGDAGFTTMPSFAKPPPPNEHAAADHRADARSSKLNAPMDR
jgi:signal transduction histidine kinase